MDYTTKATQYAEEHGIIEYAVSRNKMTYYANILLICQRAEGHTKLW